MGGAEAYRFIGGWNPNPTAAGVTYRTAAFQEVCGFERQLTWVEDWEIWLRFAREWEVAYADVPSALYRIHNQSATATATKQNRLCYGYDFVMRRVADLCRDDEVFRLIRRRMFRVSKLYAAAAARGARRSPRESFNCCREAARAFFWLFNCQLQARRAGQRSRGLGPKAPNRVGRPQFHSRSGSFCQSAVGSVARSLWVCN
jgi:hypothetical protein